jgi:TldD protein
MVGGLAEADFSDKVGFGVRALVNGYWGFAASQRRTPDEAVRLARLAVAQATASAHGPSRVVDLGTVPSANGRWSTPIQIDPFTQVPIEEKLDFIAYWKACAARAGVEFTQYGFSSGLTFLRQERVLATSAGTLVTQTIYETGADFVCNIAGHENIPVTVNGLDRAGKGWELFLEANLPDQFPRRRNEAIQRARLGNKGAVVGRYTLVCDGATMAAVLDQTLGVATQLDRSLGYEANANGTSFLTDPLAMVGQFQVASPLVTVTSNRSAPAQLATVHWDDEGTVPADTTLIRDGVLVDFQTTREQAAWLAPYYQRHGRAVRSNGCAAAEDAHFITLQHPPNFSMVPSAGSTTLEDLAATVANGICVEGGLAYQMDAQVRNGLLNGGTMRQIKNGRLGEVVSGGAISFNTEDFWKKLTAVGGSGTQGAIPILGPQYKGEPAQQIASHTSSAPAAIVMSQALINPRKKA